MRKVPVLFVCAALWLAACSSPSQPTAAAIPTEPETEVPSQDPTHTPVPT